MNKNSFKLIVLLGTFFTSLSSILIRSSQAPPIAISFYRMLFSVMLLFLPVMMKERQSVKSITKKELSLCILSGIFLSLHLASWIASIDMTTIANSTVLVTCSPIFVVIANYFILKEKLSRKMTAGIAISLAGSAIIALGTKGGGNSNAVLGNTLAFLGAIFVAGYLVIGGIVRRTVSAGTYVFLVYLSSAVVLLILCVLTGTPIYPYSAREFAIFALLAFFCTILGHTVYNYMMKYVSATFISVSTLCEPIFASMMALVIYSEVPSLFTIIGGIIILSGIIYFMFLAKANNEGK
jgi:drug/metabolite transporter (DMT)-like permease